MSRFTALSKPTMSSQLATLVPIFDGTNYLVWSRAMKAYLQSQGLFGYTDGSLTIPVSISAVAASPAVPATATTPAIAAVAAVTAYDPTPAEVLSWKKSNDMAMGAIILRLSPSIQQLITQTTAEELWTHLTDTYDKDSLSTVYKDWKEVQNTRFNSTQHPGPVFEKLDAAYSRLNGVYLKGFNTLTIQPQLQALMTLASLPKEWEEIVTIITSQTAFPDLEPSLIRRVVIDHFKTKNSLRRIGKSLHANKISAVKRKCDQPPRFKKQEERQQQRKPDSNDQQQPHRQRGQRGSGRGKGKGKQRDTGHSHVASMAVLTPALPPHTSHTISHLSSNPTTRTVTEESGSSRSSGSWPSVNNAFTLAERMGVTPMTQTVKTLEERMGDYDTLVRANRQYNDYDSDSESDINMSRPVKRRTSSVQTNDGHADYALTSEQTISAFTELSFTDNFSETGSSAKENRAPTPPYVDPHSVSAGALEEQLMDVVGLTLGLSLDDTERYPLQDLPVPVRPPIRITEGMRRNGAVLYSEVSVALDPEYICPGYTQEDLQALQCAVDVSQDRNYIHKNEVERYMDKHAVTSREAWAHLIELKRKYNADADRLDELAAQTRAPTPCVSEDGDEPLDWGSDGEYVSLTSHTTRANYCTVSRPQPLRLEGDLYKYSDTIAVAHELYTMYHDVFDVLECEHMQSYKQCERCKDKIRSMWLLDSGASAHFTFEREDFIEYKPVSDRQPVKTAAHTIYVEGIGTVLLRHYINSLPITTRIFPVLHIPKMTAKLLSMGAFLQQGMRVSGNAQVITLKHKILSYVQCKPLLPGHTLYWLAAKATKVEALKAEQLIIYQVDYDLMHRRLGHPSPEVLRRAKSHTKGFPDSVQIPTKPQLCPGCAQGKMPAASHPPSTTRAKKAFDKIHSDLKSFPTPSYHKYKYFIVFLDDYTSHAWITLLRNKGSAITALQQWLAFVKNKYGTTIKEWMSDAGGEYKSDAFVRHLKDAGITVLQSAPHTPQQNGRAERFMHTIMDKAEPMRFDACLPDSYWEFAVNHATHCYNRIPVARLDWRTPYELINNEVPDISHLRVFGCGAYVHLPPDTRKDKLSPKSELMVYLGRPSGMKADMFMRKSNRLFYSDKALFDELLFPRCDSKHPKGTTRGTTRLDEPPQNQPPFDADNDSTTPGDLLDNLPEKIVKERSAQPPAEEEQPPAPPPVVQQAPPPAPEPVPAPALQPRRSERRRKPTTRPDNVYGDRPPVKITRDIERTRKWKDLVEGPSGSSRTRTSQDQQVPGEFPEPTDPLPLHGEQPAVSEDEVDQLVLARLAQEGGVKFLDLLLAKAVPPFDLGSPDTSNIREWTFRDIQKMPNDQKQEWRKACREELESLRKRDVYDLVDRPKQRKVIKNRWVFDLKSDGRRKARLVAKGFTQVEGIDYNEIFSPVVRFETVRAMLSLSALKDWHISGLDVKTAFLYGELEEELYMEQPEGFKIPGKENKVMRLKRAIYGLKQAALAWWKALDGSMSRLGCKRLLSDSGLFVNKNKTIVIVVYVDDVLFFGKNKKDINSLKQRFMKIWECRDLGDSQEFLRMRIKRRKGCILVDQCDYLKKVLQRFDLQNAKAIPTPLPEGYHPMPNKNESTPDLHSKYQQVIGSLLYIMLGTRPDIAYAVTKLSQYAANPSEEHLSRAYYICRYLAGTPNYALVYNGRGGDGLIGFADSDWASDPTT
jgi:transposase InsO family protein